MTLIVRMALGAMVIWATAWWAWDRAEHLPVAASNAPIPTRWDRDTVRHAEPQAMAQQPQHRPAAAAGQPTALARGYGWELCGMGRIAFEAAGTAGPAEHAGFDALPAPVGRDALADIERRTVAGLWAGGTRERVAAWLLDTPASEAAEGQRAATAGALVQEALASADPLALTWAEEACGHVADGPACRLQLIRARLAVEPGNGRHWLALADEDPAHSDEAWRGLRAATQWSDGHEQTLETLVRQAVPADAPPYLRRMFDTKVGQRAARLAQPGHDFIEERCKDAGPQTCEPLIRRMAHHDNGLGAMAAAAHLARRLGWPAPQLAQLDEATRDRVRASTEGYADESEPLSCASLERWRERARDKRSSAAGS